MTEKNFTIREGVNITSTVIAAIAGLAATEVEGVYSLNGGLVHSQVARAGTARIGKAVRVLSNEDKSLTVQMIIVVKYGYAILNVTEQVQEKARTAIENMTDLKVKNVDVKVAGVKILDEA